MMCAATGHLRMCADALGGAQCAQMRLIRFSRGSVIDRAERVTGYDSCSPVTMNETYAKCSSMPYI